MDIKQLFKITGNRTTFDKLNIQVFQNQEIDWNTEILKIKHNEIVIIQLEQCLNK